MNEVISFEIASRLKKLGFNLPTRQCYIRHMEYDDPGKKWIVKNELISNIFESLGMEDIDKSSANKFRINSNNLDVTESEVIRKFYDYHTNYENEDYAIEGVEEFDWNKVDILKSIIGSWLRYDRDDIRSNEDDFFKLVNIISDTFSVLEIDYDKFESLGETLYLSFAKEKIKKGKHKFLDFESKLAKLGLDKYNIGEDCEITIDDVIELSYIANLEGLLDIPILISAPDYFDVITWAENSKGLHFSMIWNEIDSRWEGTLKEKPEIRSFGNNYSELLENLINDTLYYLTAYDK